MASFLTLWFGTAATGAPPNGLLRKLIRKQARAPRVLVTDKLGSYGAARAGMNMNFEHRQHKGLNNRAKNSHQPTRRRERIMTRFKSLRHLQRFVSIHDPIANLFHFPVTVYQPKSIQRFVPMR